MKQYLAIEINFDGEVRLLRLASSLREAQVSATATHIILFEDGLPIEQYHYIPPQKERVGSYWPSDLPEDACMMSPLPIYGNKIIPERWEGPRGYV